MQQLDLFPDDIRVERLDLEANMHWFCWMRLLPDLFGGVSLIREWGRIGTQGRHRIDLFKERALYRAKQRRATRTLTGPQQGAFQS